MYILLLLYKIDMIIITICYKIVIKLLKSFTGIVITKQHISFAVGYGLFYFIGSSLNNGYNSFPLAFIFMTLLALVFMLYFTHIKYIFFFIFF